MGNDRNGPDPIELLQSLVSIDSCDPPGNEIAIARFVDGVFHEHGIDSELDEFMPGRANLIARVPGRKAGPGLVFSAHFDTMPVGVAAWRRGGMRPSVPGSMGDGSTAAAPRT